MKIDFKKIEEAFEFVSAGQLFSHDAFLDTETGEVLYQSDSDESDDLPEDIDEARYISIPNRGELHLGKPIVLSFVETHAPDCLLEVLGFFAHKGAFSNFKNLMDLNNILDQWYEYESKETEKALREWCEAKGISLRG